MVITSINRFFAKHGRVAFFLIAVVISVTFVLFMTGQSVFDLFRGNARQADAVLLGRKVSFDQRINAVQRMMIYRTLLSPQFPLKDINYSQFNKEALQSLLFLYAAEDRGIAVGDKEVAKYLESVPSFQTKGKFDKNKFNDFVKTKLTPNKFDKLDLDESVRAQLTIQKLIKSIQDNVITSENEIKTAYLLANKRVKISIIEFSASEFIKEIVIDEKKLKSFFEAKKETFKTPKSIKFSLVRFEYSKYKREAWESITTADVKKYYDGNKYQFVKKSDPKIINKKGTTKTLEYKTLGSVTDEIKKIIVESKVKKIAVKKATEFSDAVYDLTKDLFFNAKEKELPKAKAECVKYFTDLAKNRDLHIFESKWVFVNETKISAIGNEPKVIKIATETALDNPLSESIEGNHAAYVILLTDEKEPQPESFEQNKKQIEAILKNNQAIKLARETARAAALKIGTGLENKEKFSEICKICNYKFNPLTLIADYPILGTQIQDAGFSTGENQIAKVENTSRGALIVYVEKIITSSEKDFEKAKAAYSLDYTLRKKNFLINNFFESIVDASSIPKQ